MSLQATLRALADPVRREILELLKDREIGQVNVSQLCKMAQINRGTFYANFEDVYQLAEVVLQ